MTPTQQNWMYTDSRTFSCRESRLGTKPFNSKVSVRCQKWYELRLGINRTENLFYISFGNHSTMIDHQFQAIWPLLWCWLWLKKVIDSDNLEIFVLFPFLLAFKCNNDIFIGKWSQSLQFWEGSQSENNRLWI